MFFAELALWLDHISIFSIGLELVCTWSFWVGFFLRCKWSKSLSHDIPVHVQFFSFLYCISLVFSLYSKSNLSIFIYLTACDLWCVLSKLLSIKSDWWSWRHENDVWSWSLYHCYSMYCVPNSDQHINSLKSSQYTVKWVGVENFTIVRVTSIRRTNSFQIAYTVTFVATIMYFKFLLWRGDTSCCKRESYERAVFCVRVTCL